MQLHLLNNKHAAIIFQGLLSLKEQAEWLFKEYVNSGERDTSILELHIFYKKEIDSIIHEHFSHYDVMDLSAKKRSEK